MNRSFFVLSAALALFGLSGCSTGEVKIGVDVAPLMADTSDSLPSGNPTAIDLELTRVRLLVDHVKIGYRSRSLCGDSEDRGPYVVDLTADEIKNGAHREFSLGELASGTYGGAEIEIEPLDGEFDASGDEFADFRQSGASVLVDGISNGKSFTFAGHFLAEQGTDGEVTVDAAEPVSLALTVDTSAWFRDAAGAALDPTDEAIHNDLAVAVCKTLDTQPQLSEGNAPRGKRGGPGGGGDGPHCVENVP